MSRHLRALVLSAEPPYPPTHGGARLKLFNVLKYLNPLHDLTLLTLLETPEERDYVPALKNICSRVEVFDRKPLSAPPTLRERLAAPFYKMAYTEEMAAAIQCELRRTDFDLVHVDLAHMAVYTPLLRGHRKLLAIHDSQTLSYTSRLMLAKTLKQKLRAHYLLARVRNYERRLYPEYDRCIVVAEEDRDMIRKLCPTLPVDIVPSGVDTEYFQPTPPELEDAGRLVFTGTMEFIPNVDAVRWFVAEILPLIRMKSPDTTFQIIGRNPTAEVRALASVPGVEVTGFVADFRPLVARAAVYVCPLRTGSGMKSKILEAMAMGKAIVTTSEGASSIGGRPGVEYEVAEQPAEFSDAVCLLLADPSRRRRMGEAARRFVEERYSWAKTGELFHEAYLRVAGGNSGDR